MKQATIISSSSQATGISYMLRGFEYADDGTGKYIITKDGETIGKPQPSQDAARKFITDEIERRHKASSNNAA